MSFVGNHPFESGYPQLCELSFMYYRPLDIPKVYVPTIGKRFGVQTDPGSSRTPNKTKKTFYTALNCRYPKYSWEDTHTAHAPCGIHFARGINVRPFGTFWLHLDVRIVINQRDRRQNYFFICLSFCQTVAR